MEDTFISESIKYVGASDRSLDLFEGQYILPEGMAYNSYLILDEKTAVMDTVDELIQEKYLENIKKELDGRALDYIVVQHLEPDHSGSLEALVSLYPEAKVVLSAKAKSMVQNFLDTDISERAITVGEGDTLCLGTHTLHFVTAPMVHWPEVILSYEDSEKVLFAADAFGKFGALDADEDWACEARRYYFNIVGKYGTQVQALLKKAAGLDIRTICPLHGPILKENLGYYIGLYDTWSSYKPEAEGVFIAYATLHGHTRTVAEKLREMLLAEGCPKVAIADLSRDDIAECVEDAFKYGKIVLAASSYDAGVMPKMEDFLHHLKAKNYQNRTVALIENTSWAPSAIRTMKGLLETMKNITIIEPTVSVKVKLSEENEKQLSEIAKQFA
ncbi:MAG: FprA family A-type flavoprotein [Oscillospiraceae bacterium]|nr:FprA family A-type flavoprotein [Oscillospiraceae bacterium]MDD6526298.1 FprA family A-type flavoprotein [Oscillospiraceae bacterium]